jgi:hypothetical protein
MLAMPRQYRRRSSFTFGVIVVALASALCPAQEKPTDALSDGDKAEIIKLTLERALVKKEIPDYHYIKDLQHVPTSTKNINAELLPKFAGIGFLPLKPEEIEERAAKDEGHYIYFLEFETFTIKDSKVIVELGNYPKYNQKPGPTAFGGALGFECQKQDGKWACEVKERIVV